MTVASIVLALAVVVLYELWQYSTCTICWCSVRDNNRKAHADWHEHLRHAVDETGSLS